MTVPGSREQDRYQVAGWREQLGDVVRWFPAHRTATTVIVVVLAMFFVVDLLTPTVVRLADLQVGQCLFVRTPAVEGIGPSARPAGTPDEARSTLAAVGAEVAGCSLSHSHEVSAVMRLPDPAGTPYPGEAPLVDRLEAECEGAFAAFVGRPRDGSIYDTTPVVPTEEAWLDGERHAACVVYARSGKFFDHPARGSGL